MRINFIHEANVTPFLQKAIFTIGESILDFSEEVTRVTYEELSDEEADLNVYFTPDVFDEDTTTETAVVVTKEYDLGPAGEKLIELSDKVAVTTRALQEEVYNMTGRLAPIISLNNYERLDEFFTGDTV